mgnify:CR=1 FL=1
MQRQVAGYRDDLQPPGLLPPVGDCQATGVGISKSLSQRAGRAWMFGVGQCSAHWLQTSTTTRTDTSVFILSQLNKTSEVRYRPPLAAQSMGSVDKDCTTGTH